MFRRDTKPIFTRSTTASIACTPHFDSRKLLFFMSSASAYPLTPAPFPHARLHLATPTIHQRRARTPLVHGVRVEQLRLAAALLRSVDFRAHQYGLRVAELELAVAVHAVDGGRLLLRLSHASHMHVLRGTEGRGIGALGEVRRHDLLGEVAVDGGGLGAARDREPKHSPQAVVLVLLLRRQVRRGLVDRVGVEHAVAVRDEDAVRVLDDLQVPASERV